MLKGKWIVGNNRTEWSKVGTKVKIGIIDFEVKTVDGLRAADGTWLHGEINWHDFEIRLAGDHTPESRFVTLWHEVIHGLEELYGFRLKEREVIALGNGIAQVLRDNPKMNWDQDTADDA